jgi:hypothetical protein
MHLKKITIILAPANCQAFLQAQTSQRYLAASPDVQLPSKTTLFAENKKGSVQLSIPELPSTLTPTSVLDYILSLLTADFSSIALGSIGILLALSNRLSSIDYEAASIATNQAAEMGMQSRMDLLAVFSAGAVLLNGVSKLDVTSALAENVILEGKTLEGAVYTEGSATLLNQDLVDWALEAVRNSTPAKSAAILCYSKQDLRWEIFALDGIVPFDDDLWKAIPDGVATPILDRFLKDGQGNKETYLPTLQALPGRSEVSYLPQNTQEVLMTPFDISDVNCNYGKAALVLGSDTAKTFTPRDVAWCQVLATRLGDLWLK